MNRSIRRHFAAIERCVSMLMFAGLGHIFFLQFGWGVLTAWGIVCLGALSKIYLMNLAK